MPLTRRQYEVGVDSDTENLLRQIYDVLYEQKHLAYSEAELIEMVHAEPHYALQALEILESIGAVEVRKIGNEFYYAFKREVDQAAWEPKQ